MAKNQKIEVKGIEITVLKYDAYDFNSLTDIVPEKLAH